MYIHIIITIPIDINGYTCILTLILIGIHVIYYDNSIGNKSVVHNLTVASKGKPLQHLTIPKKDCGLFRKVFSLRLLQIVSIVSRFVVNCQGYGLLPLLFNLVLEKVVRVIKNIPSQLEI